MTEYLTLKWGTLKAWNVEGEKSYAALQRWAAGGISHSAMKQHDTPDQKRALCDLIDAIDGEITNDWSGETLSKQAAKKYVLEYGREGR